MNLGDTVRLVLAPPHPAGRPFVIGAALAAVVGLLAGLFWLFWLGAIVAAFCLYFFRDPARVPPEREGALLAPADGRVIVVDEALPPAELGLPGPSRWRVGIFLSVLDVHVNRVPAAGTVTRIAYRSGSFLNAAAADAADRNERNALAITLAGGGDIAVVQIAGLIARRIVCTVREGEGLAAGSRFGIIRFGSRTDLYLPAGVRPLVRGRADDDRRRDGGRAAGSTGMNRPPLDVSGPRVSPIRRVRRGLRRRERPRFKGLSFNRMVPNLLTLLGLCAGLTAMRFGLEGRFGSAAVAITVAAGIDGLDGRLARLLKAVSRFGAEFDSLADFLCFGVAPAFILYFWSLQRGGAYGFTPCLMFAVCMALRLARFNAAMDGAPGPAYAYNFFTGVPAPAGAGLALFPLFVGLEAKDLGWDWLLSAMQYPLFCAAVLVGVALLLVSTLPVWSFKNFKVPSEYVLPLLLGTGLFAAVLVADPWAALGAAGLLYLCMLPFSLRSFRRLRAEAEAMRLPEGS